MMKMSILLKYIHDTPHCIVCLIMRLSYWLNHRVIILNRRSMFAFQWREFSPPLSSAHRLLQCYHSQWEIEDAAIPGEFPSAPLYYKAISQWLSSLEWRHTVTLHSLVGKICISFFLFYCEGMRSLVVLRLCGLNAGFDFGWPNEAVKILQESHLQSMH